MLHSTYVPYSCRKSLSSSLTGTWPGTCVCVIYTFNFSKPTLLLTSFTCSRCVCFPQSYKVSGYEFPADFQPSPSEGNFSQYTLCFHYFLRAASLSFQDYLLFSVVDFILNCVFSILSLSGNFKSPLFIPWSFFPFSFLKRYLRF